MDLALADKSALVTGGSRGIGKAVARELAREGMNVAIAARDEDVLVSTAEELAAETGRTVVPLVYDATSDASVRAMVEAAVAALGGIDVLVNSAAKPDMPPRPTLATIDDEAFWSDINVKVMGYIRCIREVVPYMEQRGGGRIVSVGGMSAFKTGSTIGSMRNIAVAAMTKNLADELAPKNIRLIAVHPGTTKTERTDELYEAHAAFTQSSVAEAKAMFASTSLYGRLMETEEVAQVIAFLASPKSAAINGDAISLTGGSPGLLRY